MVATGLVMVAAVSWIIPLSKGYQTANEQYQAERAYYASTQEQRDRCLGLGAVAEIKECFAADEGTRRSETRAEQNLNAQQEMADWAEAMLWTSIISTLVTAIGVVYVALTLAETRNAVKAADDAVVVTREIGQAQVRAYIAIGNLKVDGFLVGIKPVVSFTIKNVGQSPASRFQIVTRVMYDRGPVPAKFRFAGEKWDGMRIDIPAGGTTNQETELPTLSNDIYEEFSSGQRTLMAFGLVRYQTIFGKQCRSVFCGFLDLDDLRDGSARLTPTQLHNKSS